MNNYLQYAYNYFLEIEKKDPTRENLISKDDFFSSGKNVNRTMFGFTVEYFEKNKMPQKVSADEYKLIDREEVYHGFVDFKYGAELLSHWKYHYGTGYTNGIFFTPDVVLAGHYASMRKNGDYVPSYDQVLKAKLVSDKKVSFSTLAYYRDLIHRGQASLAPDEVRETLMEIQEFSERAQNKKSAERFVNAINQPSTIGVILGYDIIEHQGYKILLNREVLVTSDIMYNIFMTNSGMMNKEKS